MYPFIVIANILTLVTMDRNLLLLPCLLVGHWSVAIQNLAHFDHIYQLQGVRFLTIALAPVLNLTVYKTIQEAFDV